MPGIPLRYILTTSDEERRPSNNCVGEFETGLSSPSRASRDDCLNQQLDYNLSLNYLDKPLLDSWPLATMWDNNVCGFKLPRLGEICYTAANN